VKEVRGDKYMITNMVIFIIVLSSFLSLPIRSPPTEPVEEKRGGRVERRKKP
jgi:hypothetical protein